MRPGATWALLLAGYSLVPPGKLPAADLEVAKHLLEQFEENKVRSGAGLCLEANSAAGVELLLRVLNRTAQERARLPPAHYRDIVWEALEKFDGTEARARIERELRDNTENSLVRQGCAELLGLYGDERFGETLAAALKDQDPAVMRWAARSLGRIRHAPAAADLVKLVKHKDRHIRANAIEALARIDVGKHGEGFLQALKADSDAGVRCALLGAASELYPDRREELAVAALKDRDWRPRLQAVENLSAVRTKGAVDALIGAAADSRGIVVAMAMRALGALTGKRFQLPAEWKRWWSMERDSFELPSPREDGGAWKGQTVVEYHGITLVSDHAAFLIDRCAAMEETLTSKGCSKKDAALNELQQLLDQVLKRTKATLFFNVFCYAETVEILAKQPLKLGATTRKKALAFVRAAQGGSRKDIWNLLATVVQDRDIDTAYLLSSGEPDIGTYVHWNRVTSQLRDLNRFHKVVIHTVAYSGSEWYRSQLQKIAEATGGEFMWFE